MKCYILIEIFEYIRIFEYIWVFEYIRIFFLQYEYIHIRIRIEIALMNIFVFGPEKNIRSPLSKMDQNNRSKTRSKLDAIQDQLRCNLDAT